MYLVIVFCVKKLYCTCKYVGMPMEVVEGQQTDLKPRASAKKV